MKKYIFGIFLSLCFFFTSCENEGVTMFESNGGIYFSNKFSAYNFLENYDNKLIGSDTLNVPVSLSGNAVPVDREFIAEVVKDSLYTAEEGMFTLLPGTIGKNEYTGILPIIIRYSKGLDDSVYVARIKIAENKNFQDIDLDRKVYSVNFSNKVTMPENWDKIKSRFGKLYSNSWYSFILSTTKLSYIPYWSYPEDPKNPDPEKYWMTYNNISPYVSQVKIALLDYNNAHPDKPMVHEDGENKGKPVTM